MSPGKKLVFVKGTRGDIKNFLSVRGICSGSVPVPLPNRERRTKEKTSFG